MSLRDLLLAGACIVTLAACGGGEEADDTTAMDEVPDANEVMPAEGPADASASMARTEAFLEEQAGRRNVTETESGLLIETLEEGEGPSPVEGDYVTMNYAFQNMDGQVIDSSFEREDPITVPVDTFMPGLREGVLAMNQGGMVRLTLPPSLAFGQGGTPDGVIGPNEAVMFDVELLEVTKPEDEERLQELQQEAAARAQARAEAMAAENLQTAQDFLAENAGKDGVMTTESGLQYTVVEEGAGDVSPTPEDVVEVHYRGTLIDGTEFDSSYSRGQTTEFPLGAVISGWTEGLQLMEEGDTYRFFIPPNLAYGQSGKGPIGPNELLIFDVELVDVKDDAPVADEAQGEQ